MQGWAWSLHSAVVLFRAVWHGVVSCCLQVYAAIKQEIVSGGRAYIVCPLVSESDSDAMAGVRTVEEEFARLSGSGALQHTHMLSKLHFPGWRNMQVVPGALWQAWCEGGTRMGQGAFERRCACLNGCEHCMRCCWCRLHAYAFAGIFGDGSECGKLHGRMSAEEKREVLESFKRWVVGTRTRFCSAPSGCRARDHSTPIHALSDPPPCHVACLTHSTFPADLP